MLDIFKNRNDSKYFNYQIHFCMKNCKNLRELTTLFLLRRHLNRIGLSKTVVQYFIYLCYCTGLKKIVKNCISD